MWAALRSWRFSGLAFAWKPAVACLVVLLCAGVAAWFAGAWAPRAPAEWRPLQPADTMRVLGPAELSMLRDPEGALDVAAVSGVGMRPQFQAVPDGLGLAYTDDAIWLRVELQRSAPASKRWRLELTSTVLDDVRLFTPLPDGGHRELQAGDRFPFAERAIAFRHPVFDLHLPDDRPQVYHVRLRTNSVISLQVVLWRPDAFERHVQTDTLWIGGLLGMALVSALYFLEAWAVNRYRLLLTAGVATLTFAVAAASNLGMLSQHLLPGLPQWADTLHPFTMALFFPWLFRAFSQALNVADLYPCLNRLQWVASVLCVVAACAKPLGLYVLFGGRLMMLGIVCGLAWITLMAWLAWYARGRGALLAAALTLCTASFSAAPLIALGVLPPTRHMELFWVAAWVGFVLLSQATVLAEVRNVRIRQLEAERAVLLARHDAEQTTAWRRQQAQYFVGVAHDLRTPLSAARVGLANLARQLEPVSPDVRVRLDRLQASLRRAGDMIERHLHLQRLDQADAEIACERVTVAQCLALAEVDVVDAWPATEFRFAQRGGSPADLVVDIGLVARALVNLLGNAARVAPAGSAVELDVVGDGRGGAGFVVRDRGPGLGDLAPETLFEMHWRRPRPAQTPAPSAATLPGFGIGLPLVHRIAQLHGGRLEYRRDGDLTEFTLWLPARP